MKREIGVGVIGCGGMGLTVLKRLLREDQGIEVRAVFDPDEGSVRDACALVDREPVIADSVKSLLKVPGIDWVLIASWNAFHCDQVLAAFASGKHVFCQKPLATNLEDCAAMARAWKASGRMFNIGFTLRYSPHYRRIHALLNEGAIGSIISMEFNETLEFNHGGYIHGDWRRLRANAGTHLLEKCCHDIDLVNWMVGARARRVASFGGLNFFRPENAHHIERLGRNKEGRAAFSAWGGKFDLNPFTSDKDIVDNQVAIIEYDNEVRATFHTNCSAGIPERRMVILGSEGALRADVLTGRIEVKRFGFDSVLEDRSTDASGGHGGGDRILARELVGSMRGATTPSVGLREGVESAVTCFAIDDAMDSGRVVDLKPYWAGCGLD